MTAFYFHVVGQHAYLQCKSWNQCFYFLFWKKRTRLPPESLNKFRARWNSIRISSENGQTRSLKDFRPTRSFVYWTFSSNNWERKNKTWLLLFQKRCAFPRKVGNFTSKMSSACSTRPAIMVFDKHERPVFCPVSSKMWKFKDCVSGSWLKLPHCNFSTFICDFFLF